MKTQCRPQSRSRPDFIDGTYVPRRRLSRVGRGFGTFGRLPGALRPGSPRIVAGQSSTFSAEMSPSTSCSVLNKCVDTRLPFSQFFGTTLSSMLY